MFVGGVSFFPSSRFENSSGYVFLINFIGVIFEAGSETPEKIWSDFGAELK